MEHIQEYFGALLNTLMKSAPYVVSGYLVAAFIREGLPRKVLTRLLGSKGMLPLLNAVGIGALLPICSCGTIPLGIGLVRNGAAKGTTLSFMTSSPAISVVSILLGLKFLGGPLMGTYCAVVVLGSLLMGGIGNRILKSGSRAGCSRRKRGRFEPHAEVLPEDDKAGVPLPKRIRRALKWAFFDLGAEVSLDLLFGMALAALILAFVPMEWVADWLGAGGVSSLLLVILLGIPVYTCSVPSIMVVASLLAMGAAPGVAVAYLVAGPATNLGELTAIARGMGVRAAVYYAASLLAIALAGGLLANRFLGGGGLADFQTLEADMLRYGGDIPAWHIPFAVVLGVVLLVGAWKKLGVLFSDPCGHCRFWDDVSATAACAGRCRTKRISLYFKGRKRPLPQTVGKDLGIWESS